jgi:hypothetical protein
MILINVFKSIKRECFPLPRGLIMGHCSVGNAGRDIDTPTARRPRYIYGLILRETIRLGKNP